jgi:Lambda phage tail tape-measure protein (Tape_meas_lam_C)
VADVVRLRIIYETEQAAGKLNQLNNSLTSTNGHTKKLASAAIGLSQALSTGNISATALTNRMTTLGGKAGAVGIVLAVIAGALLLFKRNADAARDAAFKFQDQLRDTQRAIDDLLRPSTKPELQAQIEKITDAITELDRTLAQQRRTIIQRIFGADNLHDFGENLLKIGRNIKRFFAGGESPETRAQRNALGGQRAELTTGALTAAISGRATEQFARIRSFGELTRGSEASVVADQLNLMEKELQDLLVVLPADSVQVKALATDIRDHAEELRRLQRAEKLMTSGLQTMADALEEFVITGTFAFKDFLNNIIRLLYRDFTGELIHGLLRSVGLVTHGPGSPDPGTQTTGSLGGGGISGSVTSQTNFNVYTMDAQGVSQWIQQNGAQIAGEVGRQASRSAGLRRMIRG